MTTTKLYLDTRSLNANGEAPMKICITSHHRSAYITLGLKLNPHYWDAVRAKVTELPNRAVLNSYLNNQKLRVDNAIMELTAKGELRGLTATQIKNIIADIIDPKSTNEDLFIYRFSRYAESRVKQSTKEKYAITLKRIKEYDSRASQLTFEDITKDWLVGFDTFLTKTCPKKNSRNIHFRNIRAVFNDAIDNNVTQSYPFRKFKIQPEETLKRSLTLKQLRELFTYPVEPWQQRYVDMFKLAFFLIGINTVDLCHLLSIDADGRVNYRRAKTGKLYSIKVEAEALEIINRYKGKQYLLNIMDRIKRPQAFTMKFDRGLQSVGPVSYIPNENWRPNSKKHKLLKVRHSIFPHLSAYWARHTWATIAAELDIPKETISAALGHTMGNQTTSIYIKFDNAKIDAANRKVIDYVLYGKS